MPPQTLKGRNFRYGIFPTPAMNAANVRTIGTKRAKMMVLPPYFS